MRKSEWLDFLLVVLVCLLVFWGIAAVPIGRATMRNDLLECGYRVTDTQIETRLETSGGRWVIEVWRDGWIVVER